MTDNRWLTVYRWIVLLELVALMLAWGEVRYLRGVSEGYHTGVRAAVEAWQKPPGGRR